MDLCKNCGVRLSPFSRDCSVCGHPAEPPNLRAARTADEQGALGDRLQEADQSGAAGNYSDKIESFRDAVSQSKAVLARNLALLHNLISSDSSLLATYHHAVRGGFRIPEDNDWDRGRTAAESTISPGYYENIHYACLTLDDLGAKWFGDYSVTFIEKMIAERASVFEENVIVFCDRHGVVAGKAPPCGYRAVWVERQNLAVAKLHSKLRGSDKADYPSILLSQGGTPEECDFVEVHIYGPLHRKAIETVTGPKPTQRRDKPLWTFVKEELSDLGVAVNES